MQTDERAVPLQHSTPRLSRMVYALEDINARIATLSIALRVPLETEADVGRVLQHWPAASVANNRRSGQQAIPAGAERRVARTWQELRGLLVLRYALYRRLADVMGAATLQSLLLATSDQLVREGFSREADGIRERGPAAQAMSAAAVTA